MGTMTVLQIKQGLNFVLEQIQYLDMTFPTSNTVQAPIAQVHREFFLMLFYGVEG